MNDNLDPFDGVPADTIPPRPRDPSENYDLKGEIVEPVIERAVYAVLTVWPLTNEADVFSYGAGSKDENSRHVRKWNAAGNSGKAYLVRVPVPSAK